jgi:hypothetical protein
MKALFALVLLCAAFPSWGATCYVAEYSDMVVDAAGREVPVAREPAVTVQAVTSVDSSTQSAVLNANTRFVIITCDAQAFFSFGASPTATTSTFPLAAFTETGRGVERGSSLRIAFCDADCT